MDGLVCGGGDDDQLVELVRQQVGVHVDVQVVVEGQPPYPLDQLVHDGISNLPQLGLKISRCVQKLSNVLPDGKKITVLIFLYTCLFRRKTAQHAS